MDACSAVITHRNYRENGRERASSWPGLHAPLPAPCILPQVLQVHTHWNWAEVHIADRYLEQLEALRDNNATSEQ